MRCSLTQTASFRPCRKCSVSSINRVVRWMVFVMWNSVCYLHQGRYGFVVVCLLATMCKISKRICKKFSGKVGSGPVNKWLNFWRSWTDLRDGGTYIATLVWRGLAEVFAVPVLLVMLMTLSHQLWFVAVYQQYAPGAQLLYFVMSGLLFTARVTWCCFVAQPRHPLSSCVHLMSLVGSDSRPSVSAFMTSVVWRTNEMPRRWHIPDVKSSDGNLKSQSYSKISNL